MLQILPASGPLAACAPFLSNSSLHFIVVLSTYDCMKLQTLDKRCDRTAGKADPVSIVVNSVRALQALEVKSIGETIKISQYWPLVQHIVTNILTGTGEGGKAVIGWIFACFHHSRPLWVSWCASFARHGSQKCVASDLIVWLPGVIPRRSSPNRATPVAHGMGLRQS
jgi:hypothetical protein